MDTASGGAATDTQRRTYKYQLETNKTTVAWLEQTLEMHRCLYNEMLGWRIHTHEVYGKAGSISFYDQQNLLTCMRRNGHVSYQRCTVHSLRRPERRLEVLVVQGRLDDLVAVRS
jgi:hypothetical protein